MNQVVQDLFVLLIPSEICNQTLKHFVILLLCSWFQFFSPSIVTLEQVKEALLKKHREQVERTKKQATQFAITQELSKVFLFCPLFFAVCISLSVFL